MSPKRVIITINITNDDIVEPTETFNATFQLLPAEQLSLTNISITTASFVILDDDGETPQQIVYFYHSKIKADLWLVECLDIAPIVVCLSLIRLV